MGNETYAKWGTTPGNHFGGYDVCSSHFRANVLFSASQAAYSSTSGTRSNADVSQ
jgi:hypothetical protein